MFAYPFWGAFAGSRIALYILVPNCLLLDGHRDKERFNMEFYVNLSYKDRIVATASQGGSAQGGGFDQPGALSSLGSSP